GAVEVRVGGRGCFDRARSAGGGCRGGRAPGRTAVGDEQVQPQDEAGSSAVNLAAHAATTQEAGRCSKQRHQRQAGRRSTRPARACANTNRSFSSSPTWPKTWWTR